MRTMTTIFLFILIFLNVVLSQNFPAFPPADVTATMDRDQMMHQLGIQFPQLPDKMDDPNKPANIHPSDENNPDGNWTDADGNIITRSGFGLWNNYDQEKAGNYSPIDLLKMNDGKIINTSSEWWKERRPEIKKAVENEIWGAIPPNDILPAVSFAVTIDTGGQGVNTYIQKEITGTIDISRYPKVRNIPKISATLRIPMDRTEPAPVIIIFGGFGNVLDRYWQLASAHGWGVCIFKPNDLQPDNGNGLTSYLIGLVNKGKWREPGQWGTLVAWSWGISRLIDYFETDPLVDAAIIGLSGHSRYGKATLVAMAYDQRLAIAFPSCGGALGPSMIRRHWGQDLENSSQDREYHWVAGNFFKYMGPLNKGNYMPRKVENLSVDAHSLLALCAPRPVFLNGGTQDTWSDFYGTYLAAKGASPVYKLLGKNGVIMPEAMPKTDVAYIDGNIGYRYHTGGHTDAPDWPAFFDFADKFFKITILKPSTSYLNIGPEAGSSAVLKVKSNRRWRAYRSEGWFNLDKKAANLDDSLVVTVKENMFSKGRRAKIKLRAIGVEEIVMLNQASDQPYLAIKQADTTIAAINKARLKFEVNSTTSWNVASSENWIYPVNASGVNGADVILKADDNPIPEKRIAIITVSSSGVKPQSFKVTQDPGAPTLSVSTNQLNLNFAEGSSARFWANSNTTWQVVSASDWLSVNPTRGGRGFGQITVSARENSGAERNGRILVKVNGLQDHVIGVIQAGNSL